MKEVLAAARAVQTKYEIAFPVSTPTRKPVTSEVLVVAAFDKNAGELATRNLSA
jgi:hypothetical protein